ncbi:MAG: ABC transporter ATP-binding protein [Euzebya sp.]
MPTRAAGDVDVAESKSATDQVVAARSISRSFGNTEAVKDLDLTVAPSSIHGLIGPSGSGKTTTVRMLTGILTPTDGTVKVFGSDPRLHDTATRQRIGYMPQLGVLYPELSIRENLRFTASLYSLRKAKVRIAQVLELLDMADTQKLRLDQASGGMQRRVALAAALLHQPALLFLDEPTSGLDPVLRQQVWSHFQELSAAGCTIVVTTQIVSEATMCDKVGLIADGQLVADGHPDVLRRQAAGGDVVDLHATALIRRETLEALIGHQLVLDGYRVGKDGRTVRVVVADAQAAIAELTPFLQSHDVELSLSEAYTTPFDDVFVALLENNNG